LGTIEDIELVKLSLRVKYELHSNKRLTSFSTFKQPEHNRSSLGLFKIELNGKLDTYQKFKFNFRREIYLNEVENKNHSMNLLNLMLNFSEGNLFIDVSNLNSLLEFGSVCAPQISLSYSKILSCNISFFPPELFLHNYKCGGYVPCCATVNTHTIVNLNNFAKCS
jgi:hypothetical protein